MLSYIKSRSIYYDAMVGFTFEVEKFPYGNSLNAENLDLYFDEIKIYTLKFLPKEPDSVLEDINNIKRFLEEGNNLLANELAWDVLNNIHDILNTR